MPDGRYQFRVAASNLAWVSDFSPTVEAVPKSAPSALINVAAYTMVEVAKFSKFARLKKETLNIHWDSPRLPGSMQRLTYITEYKPIYEDEWMSSHTRRPYFSRYVNTNNKITFNERTNWSYSYLLPRTWYSFRIAAKNQHGIGPYTHLTTYWHGGDTDQYGTKPDWWARDCRAEGEWWESGWIGSGHLNTIMWRLYPELIDTDEWSPEQRTRIEQYGSAYKSAALIRPAIVWPPESGWREDYEKASEDLSAASLWSYVDATGNPTHLITNRFQLISSHSAPIIRTYEIPKNCLSPLDWVEGTITNSEGQEASIGKLSVRPASTPAQKSKTLSTDSVWKTPVGDLLVTEIPQELPPYDRDDWADWQDFDLDCQDARAETLIEESLDPVTFKTVHECVVVSGRWMDPFTGNEHTDASTLDIDHMVPLKNAHDSGAASWSRWEKEVFASDTAKPEALVAVSASANRSKGSKGPEAWRPENKEYWCEYATNWIKIKFRWNLTVTETEKEALSDMLGTCD